jgi:hypothetical protein
VVEDPEDCLKLAFCDKSVPVPDLAIRVAIVSFDLLERAEDPQTLKNLFISPFIFKIIVSISSKYNALFSGMLSSENPFAVTSIPFFPTALSPLDSTQS